MNLQNRFVAQMIVVFPTVALSWLLGTLNVALAPRLGASLGLGMLLIGVVAYARRPRS
jgi:hypothetical protein